LKNVSVFFFLSIQLKSTECNAVLEDIDFNNMDKTEYFLLCSAGESYPRESTEFTFFGVNYPFNTSAGHKTKLLAKRETMA